MARHLIKADVIIRNSKPTDKTQRLSDGDGLYLLIKPNGAKWWHYQTRYEAQQDILQYIAVFYNNQRLHSYLNYSSPNQYEAEAAKLIKAA